MAVSSAVTPGQKITATGYNNLRTDALANHGPYYLVAASGAPQKVREAADYLCDGTADDVQIQAAVDALPSAGGVVLLSPGTFTLADTVTVEDLSGVSIVGSGIESTTVNQAATSGEHGIVFHATDTGVYTGIVLANLKVTGNSSSGDGIRFTHAGASGGWQKVTLDNVYSRDHGGNGLEVNGTMVVMTVKDSWFRNNGENGIELITSASGAINVVRLEGNYLMDNGEWGLQVTDGGLSTKTLICIGNTIELNDSGGVEMTDVEGLQWEFNHHEGETSLTHLDLTDVNGSIIGNRMTVSATGIDFNNTNSICHIAANQIAATTGIAFGATQTGVYTLEGNYFSAATNAYTGGDTATIIGSDAGTGSPLGGLTLSGGSAGAAMLRLRRRTQSVDALTIYANGLIGWGSGAAAQDTFLRRAAANTLQVDSGDALRPEDTGQLLGDSTHQWRVFNQVIATASLPAADAAMDGALIIEDGGSGDRNLIVYAGGERFRIDGGSAV